MRTVCLIHNMNREMAGKMMSDVSGLSETYVAVTKELNATSTNIRTS